MLNHDDALVLDDFRLHHLLAGGFQRALAFRLLAHALDGIHHIRLLCEKRVAEIRRPLDVVGQALHDIR